jgi:tRNA1(Val) A37 N6-methylase TrmN6
MRHGNVQPFSVTTGLYGWPVDGTSGGIVSGLVCDIGSGNAAIATLLTDTAAAAALTAVVLRKKFRLETILFA